MWKNMTKLEKQIAGAIVFCFMFLVACLFVLNWAYGMAQAEWQVKYDRLDQTCEIVEKNASGDTTLWNCDGVLTRR